MSVGGQLVRFGRRSDCAIGPDFARGLDWHPSYTSTPGNLEGVTAPLLVMGMTGHYWLVSAETADDHVAAWIGQRF